MGLIFTHHRIGMVAALFLAAAVGYAAPLKPNLQPHVITEQSFVKTMKNLNVAGTARTDKVFIGWKKDDQAAGYNVYRDGEAKPLNSSVIQPASTASGLTTEEAMAVNSALGITDIGHFWDGGEVSSVDRDTIRQILSQYYADVAVVTGLGWFDKKSDGKTHHYEVRKVVGGKEIVYGSIDLAFKDYTQSMVMPEAAKCRVITGDQRLLILWPGSDGIIGYDVKRDGSQLNTLPIAAKMIPPAEQDNRVKSTDKKPQIIAKTEPMVFIADHTVYKPHIFILKNNQTYHYQIIPRDMIGPGSKTLTLNGTPEDQLPPLPVNPLGFTVLTTAYKYKNTGDPGHCAMCSLCGPIWQELLPKIGTEYQYNSGLRVIWPAVILNTDYCPEEVASYTLYRFSTLADANTKQNGVVIGKPVIVDPGTVQPNFYKLDDSGIISAAVTWYRVAVSDRKNHTSWSNVFSKSYPDNTPPSSPNHVRLDAASTNENQIRILWDANPEADLSGYRIYRRVCGVPNKHVRDKVAEDHFLLIATVGKSQTSYEDKTVPSNSPVSYEYCVRAFDKSQNVSLLSLGNVTCGRLKKTVGPSAPTITSLQSRGNAIRIDWVAPPVPDLYSFRIYRSENGKSWSQVSPNPAFPAEIRCQDTPPNGKDWVDGIVAPMKNGTALNAYYMIDSSNIKPNTKYWYKAVSIDYFKNPLEGSANEAHSTSAIMTTFTYDKFIKDTPALTATYNPAKGVVLNWSLPAGTSNATVIIYRSGKSSTEGYHPIASGASASTFTDNSTNPGKTYWYKIQFVTASGHNSEYSKTIVVPIPDDDGN